MLARHLLLLGLFAVAPAPAQDFSRLKALAASSKGLKADFTYTLSSSFWDDRLVSRGSVTLQGPRFRIETDAEIIVSHGHEVYTYRITEHQVLITPAEPTFTPAILFGDFEAHYQIVSTEQVRYRGALHHTVQLAPRDKTSTVPSVTLWLRASDGLVTRVRSVDLNETTMDFTLSGIDLAPDIGLDTFTLQYPENVEIIDLRY